MREAMLEALSNGPFGLHRQMRIETWILPASLYGLIAPAHGFSMRGGENNNENDHWLWRALVLQIIASELEQG